MSLDNLALTQKNIADEIWRIYKDGYLPSSLLFSGSSGTSRLTAALDLSFALTGEEDKRPELLSSDIIYFPRRNFTSMLRASFELFRTQRNKSSRLFLLESVRKVLLQYNGALSDAYDSGTRKNFSVASDIDEALLEFEADREYSEKECDKLCSFLEKAIITQNTTFQYKGKKNPSITIDEIRAIKEWTSEKGKEKIAIFENIEDSTDAAKNSLLKLLEEPDESSHLILLSNQPQRLLPTILSRVRKFEFPELSSECVTSLIKRRFSIYDGSYPSFEAFYFEMANGNAVTNEMARIVDSYIDSIIRKKKLNREDEEKMMGFLKEHEGYKYFRESITLKLEELLLKGRMDRGRIYRLYSIFNSWQRDRDVFNLSDRMVLDLSLREAYCVK